MADIRKKVSENVEGEFFVDSTCIDCDTCRQLAPDTFEDRGDNSYVKVQPSTPEAVRAATRALLACPTGSIGTLHNNDSSQVMSDFPLEIGEGVHYCGFNSPKSFGGNSYFIRHPDGNWLIDSPKFLPHLVKRFTEMGGVAHIFLTHQDDVADADRYAAHFKAERIIHQADRSAQKDAERIIEGQKEISLGPDFTLIPTPGHTRGHIVLLYKKKYLFTGDHLWWRRKRQQLGASQSVAWYSWEEQTGSMAKLLNYDFEWVLPGHGDRQHLSRPEMKKEMEALVDRMKASLAGR